jgi:hypothetical protein
VGHDLIDKLYDKGRDISYELMSSIGSEGWEMINWGSGAVYWFKRPLPDDDDSKPIEVTLNQESLDYIRGLGSPSDPSD